MFLYFRSDVNVKCTNGTMVWWLQNDAGYNSWGPTDSRVDAVLEAFRPGRDKPYTTAAVPPPHPAAPVITTSAAPTTTINAPGSSSAEGQLQQQLAL